MQNPLINKLQIKNEYSVFVMNSATELHPLFAGMHTFFSSSEGNEFDTVILFVKSESEILKMLPVADSFKKKGGSLWLSYPKQSGSVPSELNRDAIWNTLKSLNLVPVRLISLNDDWSVMRIKKETEQKKNSTFGQDPPGVDRKSKTVIPPKDLQNLLDENPTAKDFFESLAFSHKREYVGWIHEAKKKETREKRVNKTVEMLLEGKKNR